MLDAADDDDDEVKWECEESKGSAGALTALNDLFGIIDALLLTRQSRGSCRVSADAGDNEPRGYRAFC